MARQANVEGPDPIDTQVGITLRSLRKERRISQADLGSALGITFQQVQKYELGTNRMSASMIVKAAKMLNVQPSHLLPATDAPPLPPMASLLSLKGAEELLEGYGAIKSPRHRRAVLTLVRALGGVDRGDDVN